MTIDLLEAKKRDLAHFDKIYNKDRQANPLAYWEWYPKQLPAITANTDNIIVFGGNKSGKTAIGSFWFACHITKDYPDYFPEEAKIKRERLQGLIIGADFKEGIGKIIEPALKRFIPSFKIKSTHKNQVGIICDYELNDGNTIHMMSAEQEKKHFEGTDWDLVWIDEPIDRDRFIAILRGLVVRGGRLMMTMTLIREPWIWDSFYEKEGEFEGIKGQRSTKCLVLDIRDNKSLTEENIKKYEMTLLPEEKEVRLHGKPIHLSGAHYKEFDEAHLIDLEEVPKDISRYHVINPHDTQPQMIAWYGVDKLGDVYFYDELWLSKTIEETCTAIKIKEGQDKIRGRVMDPNFGRKRYGNTGKTVAEEFAEFGLYYKTDVKDELVAGHLKVRHFLKYDRQLPITLNNHPKVYFVKTLRNLIKCMRTYGHESKMSSPEKSGADLVRYALMSEPSYVEEVDERYYQSRSERFVLGGRK